MGPGWRALVRALPLLLPLLSLPQPIPGSSPEEGGAQEEAGQLAAVAGVMTRGHQEGPGSRGPRRPLKAFLMTQRAPVEVRANPAPFMNTDESSRPLGARTRAEGDPGLEKPPSLVSLVSWDKIWNPVVRSRDAFRRQKWGRAAPQGAPREPKPYLGAPGELFEGLYCTASNILETTGQAPLSVVSRRTGAALDPGNSANRKQPGTFRYNLQLLEQPWPAPLSPTDVCGWESEQCLLWSSPACTRPVVGSCSVTVGTPSCTTGQQRSAEDVAPDLLPGTDVTSAAVAMGAPVGARASTQTSAPISHSPTLPRSTSHQFGREGVYTLKAVIHSEFRGTEKELGPYYVDIGPATVSVSMNSSSIHKDGLLVLADSHTDQKDQCTVVTHRFPTGPSWNVSFTSRTQVGGGKAWKPVTVRFQMQRFSLKETVPLEFLWYFGEGPPVRTTSRSVRKRLRIPQWYSVTVQASSRLGRVSSEPHRIRAQRRIVANRLASPSSALLNTSVTFECRLNFGSDVAFLWDFGDGAVGPGGSSASHSYSREGEFTVQVLAFNDVSTASLRKQLFVVREPCQPPPVKNMGPRKVQVWRSQPVNLGVTFESAILCDISQGLSYTWTFWNSEGARVPLPPAVSTHGQTLTIPGYFLQPGNYTALAKVQVEGSVVHSSYRVGVEVRARAPVSVISEGTHLFISRAPSFIIVLRGSQSYDPDSPGAVLRYHWNLDAGAPTLSFPADSLSDTYDQFLVTLMVSSGGRNSSEAQVFLSPRPNSALRFVHISWVNFRDVFVNWNEELCLQAECEVCGQVSGLSYSWDLFLVNATEGTSVEGTVGLLGSAGLGAVSRPPDSSPPSTEPSWPECHTTGAPFSQEPPQTRGQPGLSAVGKPSSGPTVSRHWVPTMGDAAAPGVTPQDQGSPGPSSPGGSSPSQGLSPSPSDFEAYYGNIQEAELSRGRQPADSLALQGSFPGKCKPMCQTITVPDTPAHRPNPSLPGSDPSSSADRGRGDGDNLLGPLPPTAAAGPPLMVDWPKSPVGRTLFHGYTASGITGQTVTIKPFTLSPGKTYVLQASVASKHGFLGRAQLYVTLRPAPWAVTCQVQPHRGLEAHTVFSIFCMSGRPDFHYKFSYWIGNGSRHTLYRGTDTQYYFALPAGEPLDDYKVMLSTEITDGSGSRVQPCAVAVTVLPRLHGGLCLDEDIYNSSLKHLSTLQLMGSYAEIRNYITMIARILSRWAAEDRSPPCGPWSRIQDALISSACRLPSPDQEEMLDSVHLFRDLLRFPHKGGGPSSEQNLQKAGSARRDSHTGVSFTSAALVLKSTQTLLAQSLLSGRPAVAEGMMLELILLVSAIWEVSDQETPRNMGFLQEEGIKVISALLLDGLSAAKEHQLCVSAGQMEFCTLLHHDRQGAVQSLGPVRVHLPGGLAGQRPAAAGMQSPCYISQLMLFKKNPYPGRRAPGQIGPLVALSLFTCSGRRPISRQRLREPVVVEFGEEDGLGERRNRTTFALLRETVNFHRFTGRSESPQESLQIRIEFSRPVSRAFPVMVLGFSEKPTPSDFLVKKVYVWDEPMVHVYVPATSLRDTSLGYLSLLDADYDRSPRNKYFAKAVNYTVRFQWLRCVFWETREWRSANSSPQPGASPGKASCSYDRLAPVSVARRNLSAGFSVEGVSKLQRHPGNLLPSILIAVSVVLYALLVTKTRRVDRHEREKAGYIFLQEDTPADHQLYAVVVDTGFRAPAHCSAKVYIVLCGENGVSEPRELYCPEKPLFERNSRHTFVLSTPALLGPLRRIRLWHDSRGPCPAWYVSHLMVQELGTGPARHWLFPAECWLAAGRGDGHVQRELGCLRRRPGFWKLLYSKFTEYLEDFHVWTSVYSRPSPSGFLRTPRLTVAFTLLCAYACLAALVTASRQERLLWGAQWATPSEAPPAPEEGAHGGSTGALTPMAGHQRLGRYTSVTLSLGAPGPAEGQQAVTMQAVRPRSWRPAELTPASGLRGRRGHKVPHQWVWTTCCAPVAEGTTALVRLRSVGHLLDGVCGLWLGDGISGVQPLLVGLVALGFAWRKRDDPHFFTESLREATKDLGSELEGHVRSPMAHHASQMEEMVAARQRARRLRWARPPSAAQLSVTRERMRRETRTRVALRVTVEEGTWRTSQENPRRQSQCVGLTLLAVTLPSPPSVLTEDSPPTRSPQVGATDTSSVTDPAIQGVAASGPGDYGAREHWVLSLGSTRAAAHAALSGLRASRWIDRSTRAVSVHFTLYNPPTRLLSSVSLHTELLPAGGLALSPLVESVAIFHSDSSRWYRLTLPELVFLVLNLIGLCLHLSGMAETGVCSYWHSPGRWLELTVVGAGLAYHAASSHLVTLTGEVADHFQKGLFHEFLDLSLVTSWNQRVSWLQGTLSFVLTLKCICLVGVQTPVASCSFLTRRSFAGIFAAGLACVLMLAAHSHLHAAPPGTFTDVSRGLPFRFPGRHQRDTLRGSLMTLVRKRKSFQSKSLVSLEDMTACMWGQCLALLGLERPQREEAETVESQHYYLDEVSDLLEELLLKINGLSDSLRLPLPEQQSCDETEARAECGPLGSISA
ncbi:polycystic kidney disease protein 1-like 1 isoform X3 [Prionailurus iriomotensis]